MNVDDVLYEPIITQLTIEEEIGLALKEGRSLEFHLDDIKNNFVNLTTYLESNQVIFDACLKRLAIRNIISRPRPSNALLLVDVCRRFYNGEKNAFFSGWGPLSTFPCTEISFSGKFTIEEYPKLEFGEKSSISYMGEVPIFDIGLMYHPGVFGFCFSNAKDALDYANY